MNPGVLSLLLLENYW